MICDIPDLGRCCFCMPLRRGVITFGYLNVLFSAFMIGIYSYSIHADIGLTLVYHGVNSSLEDELCLFLYCVEFILNLALVYGAHMKLLVYIKTYYIYAIGTTLLMLALEIISIFTSPHFAMIAIEIISLFFTGFCIHVYLIVLVRSLIRKLEMSDQHTYENQLHTIVNGDVKLDGNGVYPSTVVPNEAA